MNATLAPPAVEPTEVSIATRDGRELAGLLVESQEPRGAVLISGATGYKREFYLKFARYVAERGYHTLLFDYRGMGLSRDRPLRDEPARMLDWGLLDIPAAFDWLVARYPHLPHFSLGHSIGGEFAAALNHRARGYILVASSTGYFHSMHALYRPVAFMFMVIYGPWMLRKHGFVPKGRFWNGESVPPNVFRQWRDWCFKAEYFTPELSKEMLDRFTHLTGQALSWGFTDDPIATLRTVSALLRLYPRMSIEQRWVKPADVGARKLGHHGFFLEPQRETLWRPTVDWLDARLK